MRIEEMRELFKDVHTEDDIKKIFNEHEGLEAQIMHMDRVNAHELSEEDLDNVVGGMIGGRSIAMILASLTIISSAAQISVTSGGFMKPVTVSAAEAASGSEETDNEDDYYDYWGAEEVSKVANRFKEVLNADIVNNLNDIRELGRQIYENKDINFESIKNGVSFNGINDNLKQQVKDIIGSEDENEITSYIEKFNNIIATVEEEYTFHEENIQSGLQPNQDLEDCRSRMETAFQNIYSSKISGNGKKHKYDAFMNMEKFFIGQSETDGIKNIFALNHGLLVNSYNYNTQTLAERKQFVNGIRDIYMKGYEALKIAILYDNEFQKSAIVADNEQA